MKPRLMAALLLVSGCAYSSANFIGANGDVKAPIGNLQTVDIKDGDVKGFRCMGASLFRKQPTNCKDDLTALFEGAAKVGVGISASDGQ